MVVVGGGAHKHTIEVRDGERQFSKCQDSMNSLNRGSGRGRTCLLSITELLYKRRMNRVGGWGHFTHIKGTDLCATGR